MRRLHTGRPGPLSISAVVSTGFLLLALVACAPEPDAAVDIAGQGGKSPDSSQQESNWSAPETDFDAEQRQTELPESFPREAFPLPEGSVVYDAGENGTGNGWFVVLRAENESEAATLWDTVITSGGFTADGEALETTEGGAALSFTSPALRVFALTLPQAGGAVLLSYELAPLQ